MPTAPDQLSCDSGAEHFPCQLFESPFSGLLSGHAYLDSTENSYPPEGLRSSAAGYFLRQNRGYGSSYRRRAGWPDSFAYSAPHLLCAALPHTDKDSREHFETRTHRRIIDIYSPSSKTIDALMKLDLPAGVDIEVKL